VQTHISAYSKSWMYSDVMRIVNSILLCIFLFLMIWLLSKRWLADEITTGAFVSVISLMFSISHTVVFLSRIFHDTAKAYGEMEEALDEILVPHEITDIEGAQELVVTKSEIVWDDVSFQYGENAVFKNFNLTIKAGERIGLVGSSGAGKTTFVSLLLREHDLEAGTVRIDAQETAKVTQDSLRRAIAVVPQEPMLFHRSIKENIAYGKPQATDEEIIAVAKKAQAHDFINALSQGYDTLVGERGIKLSGGQKQRIAIARAMLKDAPILVLDEATSALDSESEVAIQKALHELMARKTVVAIAHRLSTLREMDRIIVLENGAIVEDGTHETLSKAGGIYQRLWEHQAGGFLQE
jgi:ABC-type multidrug transport system fused ATPase/permease subunit